MDFGQRVKELRRKHKLTKEEFCGDETELSVRQLTRIESGQSTPTLAKVEFIAQRLGVKIGELTDDNFELPIRYKELKYLLLRTQTYTNPEKLAEREQFFDEIMVSFYDNLPDEEQIIIDCLQARTDINLSSQTDFGEGLLEEYFEQVKLKSRYTINDLILINLHFTCIIVSNCDEKFYNKTNYQTMVSNLLKNVDLLSSNYLFLLTNLFLQVIYIATILKTSDFIEEVIQQIERIMLKMQDFQKMPVFRLMEWKYCIQILSDKERARAAYQKALLFASMTNDKFLEAQLTEEWESDFSTMR